jgi:hypothetical protein
MATLCACGVWNRRALPRRGRSTTFPIASVDHPSFQPELLTLWEWKVAPETARRRSELPVRVADIVGVEGGARDS